MPSPVFAKLQLKDPRRIHVLDAPESFEKDLRALKGAIGEDWSALRFRRATFIKSMKRDARRAMSAEGRKRVKKAT
jgi:hypothetical protein